MRFVQPDVVRIQLGDGDWIEVKKELSVGEEKRYRSAGMQRVSQEAGRSEIGVNWSAMAFARVEMYLTDWSAAYGEKGKAVPLSPTAIQSLSVEDFDRIDDAIQKHIAAMDQEKKAMTGSLTSS